MFLIRRRLRSYFKTSCFVFHRGLQTLENNKSPRPFSRVWIKTCIYMQLHRFVLPATSKTLLSLHLGQSIRCFNSTSNDFAHCTIVAVSCFLRTENTYRNPIQSVCSWYSWARERGDAPLSLNSRS